MLACGDSAALCGRAAAWMLGLLRGEPPPPEVIVAANRNIKGITTHRARHLPEDGVRIWQDIRVTTVPRLLVDLAPTTPVSALARLHHEARVRFAVQPETIEAVLNRRPTTKNAATLRAVILGDTPVLLSRVERGFRTFLEEHDLPLPSFNRQKGAAHYVDCGWAAHRLTVELDRSRSGVTWRVSSRGC